MVKIVDAFVSNVYRYVVSVFATVILGSLLYISIISTCYISSDEMEITFFCADNVFQNIVILVIVIAVMMFLQYVGVNSKVRKYLESDVIYHKWKHGLLLILFLLCMVWVIFTQYIPGSDQMDVISSAYKLYIGETNMIEPGGYLDRYNNQLGLAVIDYYFARLWGDYNVMAFQTLNVVGIVLFYKKIVDILELHAISRITQLGTLMCGILFFPMIMYTSFVYGNIWSVTLGVLAFDAECKFINDYKLWRIPLCAAYIALAVQVKNNAWILFIALEIYSAVFLFKDKKKILRSAAMIVAVFIVAFYFVKCLSSG